MTRDKASARAGFHRGSLDGIDAVATGTRLSLFPILAAIDFVLIRYAANIRYSGVEDALVALVLAVIASALAFVVITAIVRSPSRGAIVAGFLVLGFLWYGYIAAGLRTVIVGLPAFLLITAVLATIGLALAFGTGRYLRPLIFGITVVLTCFAGLQLLAIGSYYLAPQMAITRDDRWIDAPSRRSERDIYYLIFDRYGSHSALDAAYGIRDNDLPAWLQSQGFSVAEESHANYVRTTLSLASVLNLDYLQSMSDPDARSTDHRLVQHLLDDHLVGRFLKSQGYRYLHLGSWYGPTRANDMADENHVPASLSEFHFVIARESALAVIPELVGGPPAADVGGRVQAETAAFQFATLHQVVDRPERKFVLAHLLLPHEPYVFDESGFIPPESRIAASEGALFRSQLEYTNGQIQALVEHMLDKPPHERPIIIIQADEGPYPARYRADQAAFDWSTASSDELVAKFGILNAFHLPDDGIGVPSVPATMTSVNTFRMVLGHYFGLDLPLLSERIYSSRSPTLIYDFMDVTDRLRP